MKQINKLIERPEFQKLSEIFLSSGQNTNLLKKVLASCVM